MRDNLIGVLGLFCICWLVFAVIDFRGGKDTLRVYQIKEVLDRTYGLSGNQLPKYSAQAVKQYKVSGDKVISKVNTYVNEYDDCKVFNVENWSCTFDDESATFGAIDGVYFNRPNTTKFPDLANPLYQDGITVSRWRLVLTNCEWHFADGALQGVVGCAITPFIM